MHKLSLSKESHAQPQPALFVRIDLNAQGTNPLTFKHSIQVFGRSMFERLYFSFRRFATQFPAWKRRRSRHQAVPATDHRLRIPARLGPTGEAVASV